MFAGQDLDGATAAHHLVFGQEYLAHAPLAQRLEDAMGAEKEAAVLALQQIIGLPFGQQSAFDQFVGQSAGGLRPCAFTAELRHQREHLIVRYQTTLPEEIQEQVDGNFGCHRGWESRRRSDPIRPPLYYAL